MEIFEQLSEAIIQLEGLRDHGAEFSRDDHELVAVLNLSLDLLAMTNANKKLESPVPIIDSPLIKFVFNLTTCQNKIDMRELLKQSMALEHQAAIAKKVNIRQATISDYLTGRSSMRVDNYEAILNDYIRRKNSIYAVD